MAETSQQRRMVRVHLRSKRLVRP